MKKADKTGKKTAHKQTGDRRAQPKTADLPELELESIEPKKAQSPDKPARRGGAVRFGWVGSGQCGGRMAQTFYEPGCRSVLAVNTTYKDLDALHLPESRKHRMDAGSDGASKELRIGRKAIELCREEVFHKMEDCFGEDIDHIMICFGAGGGTGGGSAAGLIEAAHNYTRLIGCRTPYKKVGVMMSMPDKAERRSKRVANNSRRTVKEMIELAEEGKLSPLILLDNGKIDACCGRQSVQNYWPAANKTAADLFNTFNRLSNMPSPYTSFDPADYMSILSAGGCMTMGSVRLRCYSDKHAISKAIRKCFDKSLCADGYDLRKARVAAGIIVGGRKIMAKAAGLQDAINYGLDSLAALTNGAVLHRGIYEDEEETVRVYTIFGGLPAPRQYPQ